MRGLRAVVATLVIVGLGSVAHTAAGGPVLRPFPAVVLLALVGPLVWLVVSVRTSFPRMMVATSTGQVVAHLALVGMQPSTSGTAVVTGHLHHAVGVPAGTASPPMALHVSGSMLLAHVVATVLASVLLSVGEDVVRAVVALLVAVLRPAGTPATARIRPGEAPGLRLAGRSLRPVGGRAPPLHAC